MEIGSWKSGYYVQVGRHVHPRTAISVSEHHTNPTKFSPIVISELHLVECNLFSQ